MATPSSSTGPNNNNSVPAPDSDRPSVINFPLGRLWNNPITNAVSSTTNAAKSVLTNTASTLGEGLLGGVADISEKKIQQMVQPEGPIATQLQQTLEHVLMRQPPLEINQLKSLIQKFVNAPASVPKKDVQQIVTTLNKLAEKDWKLLRKLAPELNKETIELFNKILIFFRRTQRGNFNAPRGIRATDFREVISHLDQILAKKENQGVLINAMDMINNEETGIISKAVDTMQKKLMAKDGVIDQFDQRLTGQAHSLLSMAHSKLCELQKELINQNMTAIKKLSKETREILTQITKQPYEVFSNPNYPYSTEAANILEYLIERLPSFYSNTPSPKAQMLAEVEAGLSVIKGYYNNNEGIAARTGAILQETLSRAVNPVLDRIEKAPRKMLENLMNISGAPDAPSQSGEATVSQFLSYGSSILQSLMKQGKEALIQHAISPIVTIGLKQALAKMGDEDFFKAPKQTLKNIIAQLENPQSIAEDLTPEQLALARKADPDAFDENGHPVSTWQALSNRLNSAAAALAPIKIYVNGFCLPRGGANNGVDEATVEAAFLDNIDALRKVKDSERSVQAQKQDWRTLAEAKKNEFIDNTTKFLKLKHIYEMTCHLKPDNDQFYYDLLKKSKIDQNGNFELTPAEADEKLEQLFFEKVAEKNTNFLTTLWAKFEYKIIYGYFVKKYVTKAITIFFNDIFNYIDTHRAENFETLRIQLTRNFTRYLVILGDAYGAVANSRAKGLPEEMLQEELEKSDSNLKIGTAELYMEFADNAIKRTIGSGFLAWIAKKFIGNPETMLRSIVDKTTGALQNTHGYTHALNTVILDQLDQIYEELHNGQANRQNNPAISEELSIDRKKELTTLVKNLFEVLNKSKCDTPDELRAMLKKQESGAFNLSKAIDDQYIEEVIEKITNLLATTIQSLIKEDQLQKLTYDFARLANRTFEEGPQPTITEMKEKELGIVKRCNQILQISLTTAIEEHLDFTGKKQQLETNRHIQEMRALFFGDKNYVSSTETPKLCPGLCRDLQCIKELEVLEADFESPAAKSLIKEIVDATLVFEMACRDANFQATQSRMNKDNKKEVCKRFVEIDQQSKPLVQSVAQLQEHSKMLEKLQTTTPKLMKIKEIVKGISLSLFRPEGPTAQELTDSGNQLQIVERLLKELAETKDMEPFAKQIFIQTGQIGRIIIAIENAIKTQKYCQTLSQPASLLSQVVAEKKRLLNSSTSSSEFNRKLDHLHQQFRHAFDDRAFTALHLKLSEIENASSPHQVDTAFREILNLAQQASAQAATNFKSAEQRYLTAALAIENAIDDSKQLDPKVEQDARKGIRNAIAQTKKSLDQLGDWMEDNTKEIPYINFSIFDLKGLQDWATGLVYGRVRERLDDLLRLLRKEETYRYGLLNHLLLIPYVKGLREGGL